MVSENNVEKNRKKLSRPKKMWMEVVREDTRTCSVDEKMIRGKTRGS